MKADVRETLVRVFQEKQTRNPGFSLRAFSRQLNVSPASLSQMLSGKRPISPKTLQSILKNIELAPEDSEYLYSSLKKDSERQVVDMDMFHMMSDWYYFAILSLAETKDFQGNADWIANRLNIAPELANAALERLTRLEMLKANTKGEIVPTGNSFTTPDEIMSLSIQKRHRQHLHLAEDSLQKNSIEDRDFTSITMAIDPKKLPVAKVMIRKFRDRLAKMLESENQKEVYIFCQQLFPLTKLNEKMEET